MGTISIDNKEKLKKRKFIFFLKKRHIYEQFIFNMKTFQNDENSNNTINKIIHKFPMFRYVDQAFAWNKTPEKSIIWSLISNDWCKFLYLTWDEHEKTYYTAISRKRKENGKGNI